MLVFVLILLCTMCVGCAGTEVVQDSRTENAVQESTILDDTTQSVVTPGTDEEGLAKQGDIDSKEDTSANQGVPALTDYVSDEEMALADSWPSCDDRALAKVMRKAQQGEAVTIACIGGSITQGTISNGSLDSEVEKKQCYADIFFQWWEENFPDAEFEFVNAGIGATDSYLGVHRVEEDVLAYEPDLVLVEFAVNDNGDAFYKKTYDNLVRKILKSDSSPAVMLLFMGQSNGQSAQVNQVLVGFQYKLPMISYVNVMKDMLEQGIYEDKELSGDVTHPSALGHAITGEILWKYLNQVYQEKDSLEEPETFTAKAVTSEMYQNAQILTSKDITPDSLGNFTESKGTQAFPDGWSCEEGEGEITFTLEFANLGILYLYTTDGLSGQYDVIVDGEKIGTIDANFQGGWGNYAKPTEMYRSSETAQHTITIRKAEGSTGEKFTLLGLLTS